MKLQFVSAGEIEAGDLVAGEAVTFHGGVHARREVTLWDKSLQVDDVAVDMCWRALAFEDGTARKFNSATELVVITADATWIQDIKKIQAHAEKLNKVRTN